MPIDTFKMTCTGNPPHRTQAKSLDEMTQELPEGWYTTFSTLSGGTRVWGLHAHLQRLYIPAAESGLKPSVDESTLRVRLADLAKLNLPRESRVRLILTKDDGTIYAGIQPFEPLPESVYQNGVHAVTAEITRRDPRIKGTDFIVQSARQRALVKGGVFEVLLTDNGKILEGMTSNFYVIARRSAVTPKQSPAAGGGGLRSRPLAGNDGKLITARSGILLGVTRRVVLRLARGEGMLIEYRSPRMDEDFEEAFLTSSSRGVVPIVTINSQPVGEGRPGRWTNCLSKAYQAYVLERSELI